MKKVLLLAIVAICSSSTIFAQNTTMHISQHKMTDSMYTCTMHPEVMQTKSGKCTQCGMALTKAKETYVCPMHTKKMRSNAGKCPKCGMDMKMKGDMKGMEM